ncbi:MAG: AAA family ATPase [Clostridia bacterium]|nr:AAA family ATPase [Clostridia bacterium]
MTSHFQAKRLPYLPSELQALLPPPLWEAILHSGAPAIEEIRLSVGRVASVTAIGKSYPIKHLCDAGEIGGIFKRMCGGSLYAHKETICRGFLTLEGGIRVGVCGHAAVENGRLIGVSDISGLVIRIPHKADVSGAGILELLGTKGGVLVYSPPGVGKTTLLRAIAKQAASDAYGIRTVIVDTRGELGYGMDGSHLALQILSGYPRAIGIEIAVQTLGAQLIVCDEIGDESDANALLASANRGVPMLASAHASTIQELLLRPSILRLHQAQIFSFYARISRDAGNRLSYQILSHGEAELLRKGSS